MAGKAVRSRKGCSMRLPGYNTEKRKINSACAIGSDERVYLFFFLLFFITPSTIITSVELILQSPFQFVQTSLPCLLEVSRFYATSPSIPPCSLTLASSLSPPRRLSRTNVV